MNNQETLIESQNLFNTVENNSVENNNTEQANDQVKIEPNEIIESEVKSDVQPVIEDAPVSETPIAAFNNEETSPEIITSIAEDSTPAVAVPVAEATPAVEAVPVIEAASVAEEAPASEEGREAADVRQLRMQHYEKVFEHLKSLKEQDSSIDVKVKARIRGGLRVIFDEMPLFLPASHFSLKRTPTEAELQDFIGKTMKVAIHELQEYDDGRKAVIVSRKDLLSGEFWTNLAVGQKVEGRVSSVATFGVFVDIGGLEGLIHISRLSVVHVSNPAKLYKKGDKITSVIVELDKEHNRIALSRRELEESPWKGVEEQYPVGTQHKGIVRRLTEFGAYIELRPGVDGLLRIGEMSWAKRVRRPSDLFTADQEIDVQVVAVSEEHQTVTLSYKRTLPNPWDDIAKKYIKGTFATGTIVQVMKQGAIVRLNDEVDGFMPRSKMRNVVQGKNLPYVIGDTLEVEISDITIGEESLILAPKHDETYVAEQQQQRQPRRQQQPESPYQTKSSGSFSLLDLISDKAKISLINNNTFEAPVNPEAAISQEIIVEPEIPATPVVSDAPVTLEIPISPETEGLPE